MKPPIGLCIVDPESIANEGAFESADEFRIWAAHWGVRALVDWNAPNIIQLVHMPHRGIRDLPKLLSHETLHCVLYRIGEGDVANRALDSFSGYLPSTDRMGLGHLRAKRKLGA